MLVRVQRGSSVPVSRQIDSQIRAQILSGAIGPKVRLPSVRELARDLAVNVNTVVRVYERLAADKLVELRHGEGTFVTARGKRVADADLAERNEEFTRELDALVRRGVLLGASAAELTKMFRDALRRAQQEFRQNRPSSQERKAPV